MKELSLRETQLCELDILVEFDRFCRDNGLKYTLVAGTLLGAVRHRGFIPWDDDIDVGMPRADYERFYQLITEKIKFLPQNLQLIPDRGEGAIYPFIKIVDKRIGVKNVTGEPVKNVWIDVFPLDGYPSDKKKALRFYNKVRKYRRLVLYNYLSGVKHKGIDKLARKLFSCYARIYGHDRALKKLNILSQKYSYDKSDYVGMVSWGSYGIGERFPKSWINEIIDIEFEGKQFLSMKNWDGYLKNIYGNYMELPPEDKRHTHSIEAYEI